MRLAFLPYTWLLRCPPQSFRAIVQQATTKPREGSLQHSSGGVALRNATIDDLALLQNWDERPHIRATLGDYDFNDWNWRHELPRKPSWRYQLIGTVYEQPIGFVQIIDPREEETHYWGKDCEPNLRAIDIWIGEEEYLGRGYGTKMMELALQRCFQDNNVTRVVLDPMYDNTAAHRFYQRLGFAPIGERYFGPDRCLIHQLNRTQYLQRAVALRNATIDDLQQVEAWEQMPHVVAASGENDCDDSWNWTHELAREVSWRRQLVGTVHGFPIGLLQIIDPKLEETHYWGDCDDNLRAIDIWIGEEAFIGQGYGTQMMELALNLCFEDENVTGVYIDPLLQNTAAHRFYQRLGFQPVAERVFGPDLCLVHCLNRTEYTSRRLCH